MGLTFSGRAKEWRGCQGLFRHTNGKHSGGKGTVPITNIWRTYLRFDWQHDILEDRYQVGLPPGSLTVRQITIFGTHKGIFQYKRLVFGVFSAPEQFHQVIIGLEGVVNFLDNCCRKDKEEHEGFSWSYWVDFKKWAGILLNEEKCEFGKEKIGFLGHEIRTEVITPH